VADAHALWAEHVWRSLRAFRRECSLDTWSHRVAWGASRHVADDAFRRRGRAFHTGEASRLAAETRRSSLLEREAQSAALERLRDRLTHHERALLILRLDQGRSWDECAEILSTEGEAVKAAALRKRFERVKQRLGVLARREGLVE
jgi:DNA-directed RNA polymerase specialized sigma24 family protein